MQSLNMTQVLRHAGSEPNIAGYARNHRTRNEGIRYRAKGVEGTFMRDIINPQPKLPPRIPAKKSKIILLSFILG